jgi:hypothetical protein
MMMTITNARRPLSRKMRTATERSSIQEKRAFQSKVSLILTAVTLALLLLLSVFTSDTTTSTTDPYRQRHLDSNSVSSDTSNTTDYSHYSCNSLNEVTPDAGEPQCRFAQTCNRGVGVWAPIVYCSPHGRIWLIFLSPVMLLWLVLLFRMLGSTAEDYFSPALEMFSNKVGATAVCQVQYLSL